MAAKLQPFVDRHALAGAVALAATKDRVLSCEAVGCADLAAEKAMATNQVFEIASMSKPVTATALMMLVDEGKVSVDDPVEKYLPEFCNQMVIAGKDGGHAALKKPSRPLLVRDLLTHTGGLLYSGPHEKPALDSLPLREVVAGHARLPLQFEPGTRYLYSSAGISTVARIVEVVSGLPFEKYLDERLFKPLGMSDTAFWPNEEQLARLAKCYKANAGKTGLEETPLDSRFSFPLNDAVRRYPMPGIGLFSTASDMLKFCQMFLNGGVYGGRRYLSAETVARMTTKQTPAGIKNEYGFGWATGAGRYSHGGSFNTFMSVDPGTGLIAIYLTQHTGPMVNGGEKAKAAFDTAARLLVPADSVRGKVMCGYQGWFRCPGDAAGRSWVHWSRDGGRIAADTLTFELWPDMAEYGAAERFPAPGFTYPDGRQAELFSSDNPATVLRHFEWMRDYGIDGAWLQRFVVGLPGGPLGEQYPSRRRVLDHVRAAAQRTGRVWALSYDIAAMPADRIFEVLTDDWKKMTDEKVFHDPRYVHEGGLPVVQIWGFYHNNKSNRMTAELANRLIDFFKAPGPYKAFLLGGGDWDWRRTPDPEWQAFYRRLPAYSPWNVGNISWDSGRVSHATTGYWAEDKKDCESRGAFWLPVVYAGFSWDNLTRQPPGSSLIPRRKGQFLWEQFVALSKLGADSVYVAMFDEVDEGTAIFKVTDTPPTQGHFVGCEGMPSDWYLRLTGEGARLLKQKATMPAEIPLRPCR